MIVERLLALADLPYRDFTANLIPTINKERIIGVRTPDIRALAKELYQKYPTEAMFFLDTLPHYYYEENNLHCYIISLFKDFDETMRYTERFLPYIDNWATCDTFAPKIFLKYPEQTLQYVQRWLKSTDVYTVRYALGVLLSNYLDEYFKEEYLHWVASITSDEYYINMMIAWYFATALAKQYKTTIPYIEAKILSSFVQNKSIQKARESRRITQEVKQYLLKFKK